MRILIVEDDLRLTAALSHALVRRGYEVKHAPDCLSACSTYGYDLMLLDLGLPDGDGVEVCKQIRRSSDVPIIVLSARNGEMDQVRGLRAGADDYVIKPFGIAELEARVQAVMRRSRGSMKERMILGELEIDLRSRLVRRHGQVVQLTPKEFAILVRLAEASNDVVSRKDLLMDIWQDFNGSAGRTLDVHITRLRTKLGEPNILETVRGIGYRLLMA
ncbi:response regulator transcription factor [Spongiactinospora sp. TRM90649]|uniref:response regulator transcription factor n=1 Tax=Spongiactinospora sp. TRM90649 TaxID=3031114 RepID=UPI0023F86C86|nr:response regulator transcription factor [Spongiactinospora sp. TRM90649]MDF5756333.1 response regulator transcription factor [Spongiactinospora sp. TRM90649]